MTPSASLLRLKTDLVRAGYEKCDQYINQLKAGTLPTQVSLQFPAVLWIPHHFDADPDSTYHPDADPDAELDSDFICCGSGFFFYADPTFRPDVDPGPDPDLAYHFNADLDPDFYLMLIRMRIQVTKLMRIRIHNTGSQLAGIRTG